MQPDDIPQNCADYASILEFSRQYYLIYSTSCSILAIQAATHESYQVLENIELFMKLKLSIVPLSLQLKDIIPAEQLERSEYEVILTVLIYVQEMLYEPFCDCPNKPAAHTIYEELTMSYDSVIVTKLHVIFELNICPHIPAKFEKALRLQYLSYILNIYNSQLLVSPTMAAMFISELSKYVFFDVLNDNMILFKYVLIHNVESSPIVPKLENLELPNTYISIFA
ncbi:Hypothetical_protein [Hexamita inflata]|uniref:Hypothetical_protein n=1 Tax=Hexamita inflata TaxID=28002 RepID=A0AA86RGY6_9EUKA|nr:Hypothetical protein HINF_LOCUS59604 [Hexamita inflata]